MIGDSRTQKTPELFRALGRVIDSLGGLYLAAEDVGTTTEDATEVARETRYITGLAPRRRRIGRSLADDRLGRVCGDRGAALREAGLDPSFEGVSVVVQGAGHVGATLTRHLMAAGANVTVADIHADRVEPLRAAGAEVADPDGLHAHPCEIFSPCALGAVVRPDTHRSVPMPRDRRRRQQPAFGRRDGRCAGRAGDRVRP